MRLVVVWIATITAFQRETITVEGSSSSSSGYPGSSSSYHRRPPSYYTRRRKDRWPANWEYEEEEESFSLHDVSSSSSSSSSSSHQEDAILGLDDFDDDILIEDDDDNEEVERILMALEDTEERLTQQQRYSTTSKKSRKQLKNNGRRRKKHKTRQRNETSRRKRWPRNEDASRDDSPTEKRSIAGDSMEKNLDDKTDSSIADQITPAKASLSPIVATKNVSISDQGPQRSHDVPFQTVTTTTTVQKSTYTTTTMNPQQEAPLSATIPPARPQKNSHPTEPYHVVPPIVQGAAVSLPPLRKSRAQMPPIPSPRTKSTASKTNDSTTTPWIRAFLKLRPQDMLLPVPKDYIGDNFNLAQLPPIVERIGFQAMGENATPVAKALQEYRQEVAAAANGNTTVSYPIYRLALRLILRQGDNNGEGDDDSLTQEEKIIPPEAIQAAAEALYLLVHARFVISPRGLEAIRHVMMLDRTVFGKCPRPLCRGCGTLPFGYSVDFESGSPSNSNGNNHNLCHRYCPSCGEVWISWNSRTDGCAWGPSWCHLFLLSFGTQVYAEELEYVAARISSMASSSLKSRVPESTSSATGIRSSVSMSTSPPPAVFGFRVHPATPFGTPFNEQMRRQSGIKGRAVYEN